MAAITTTLKGEQCSLQLLFFSMWLRAVIIGSFWISNCKVHVFLSTLASISGFVKVVFSLVAMKESLTLCIMVLLCVAQKNICGLCNDVFAGSNVQVVQSTIGYQYSPLLSNMNTDHLKVLQLTSAKVLFIAFFFFKEDFERFVSLRWLAFK